MSALADRVPLSFVAGVVTGALAAALVVAGVLLACSLWVIGSIQ